MKLSVIRTRAAATTAAGAVVVVGVVNAVDATGPVAGVMVVVAAGAPTPVAGMVVVNAAGATKPVAVVVVFNPDSTPRAAAVVPDGRGLWCIDAILPVEWVNMLSADGTVVVPAIAGVALALLASGCDWKILRGAGIGTVHVSNVRNESTSMTAVINQSKYMNAFTKQRYEFWQTRFTL